MNERILSYLGLARKANRVSLGHDASLASVLTGKALLVLLAQDVSDRLRREFSRAVSDRNIQIINLPIPMTELGRAVGSKAGVLTINDAGFADRLKTICND